MLFGERVYARFGPSCSGTSPGRGARPRREVISVSSACVYLLRCADGSLYCGWTTDLERRLEAHRAGRGARYTRARLPVEVAASWPMDDATAARREEARIKSLRRSAKLALVQTFRDGATVDCVDQLVD
jgi:putative endonuclease